MFSGVGFVTLHKLTSILAFQSLSLLQIYLHGLAQPCNNDAYLYQDKPWKNRKLPPVKTAAETLCSSAEGDPFLWGQILSLVAIKAGSRQSESALGLMRERHNWAVPDN